MKEQEVQYQAGDVTSKGYLVYDEAVQGKRPGVLVVHEWWGHNQFTRDCARKAAQAGFVGFALDLYGNGKQADNPQVAGQMSGETGKTFPVMRTRFNAGREFLSTQSNVHPAQELARGVETRAHHRKIFADLPGHLAGDLRIVRLLAVAVQVERESDESRLRG